MRFLPIRRRLLASTIALMITPLCCGAQTGRGAPAQQQGQPSQGTPTGGRGARGGGGAIDFYNYDASASAGINLAETKPSETHQKIIAGGESIAYTARAGFMPVRNATTGQPEAHLFFTSYSREGIPENVERPVMFFLGGAPGVAAVWQDFGGFGPKRMKWAADGSAGLPPFGWSENQQTLLTHSDLVFVNPVGTAYSRPAQPGRAQNFWNTGTDTACLAEFVRSYLNTYERRHSPLFLAAEDYGTGRGAGLAVYLQDHQIPVSGVVLLSMNPSADSMAGDAQYLTMLPSYSLAAWAHKKLAPELQSLSAEQVAEQARQFSSREYLHALYKGDRMTQDERNRVIAGLSRLTGLSRSFLVNNNLRIPLDRFNSELLHEQRRSLSSADARTDMFVPVPSGGRGGFPGPAAAAGANTIDPFQGHLAGGFLSAYESYLKRELSFTPNGILYLLSGGIGTFASTGNDESSLANAFARNPSLRLFAGLNYFDLTSPFYAGEFTLAHLSVAPEVRAHNITVSHCEAGQMAYIDSRSLALLHTELVKYIKNAVSPDTK
jgi:carboxypeptidase C (cathepsin A)